MSIGLILRNKPIEGSCRTSSALLEKHDLSCEICPNSEENGDLISMATLGTDYKKRKGHQ